jgi:hypothetical protein
MKDWSDRRGPRSYRVRIGHHTVTVVGASAEQAIGEARRLLCLELPRLWDVIHGLHPGKFQVEPLHAAH